MRQNEKLSNYIVKIGKGRTNIKISRINLGGKIAEKEHKVIVFSTPTCPWCIRVKEFLKENNISYEDIDVSNNQEEATKMIQRSGQMGVPQLWIDDEVVVGFDEERISDLLEL